MDYSMILIRCYYLVSYYISIFWNRKMISLHQKELPPQLTQVWSPYNEEDPCQHWALKGAFINDITQIWPKIDPPPPSVTFKWLFHGLLSTECHKIQYPPPPYLRDVIYEWSLSTKQNTILYYYFDSLCIFIQFCHK